MTKKIFSIFLCALLVCVFFICGKDVYAMHEGFTATELASSQTITIDGTKDASWDSATAFNLDTVRQYNLNGGADNTNPATGQISVMYNSDKLYLFAEITDSTKLNNVSAWDPFNVLEYDSYKYNTDYLNIQLDIKHNDPTNYNQGWGSSYNDGKDVAAHFELAAGAGELTYSANGSTGWVYDTSNELFTLSQYATTHSTIYSVATETGYTFEMVIDLSEAGVTDFAAGKTIGLYVGYWDRYDSCGGSWGEQSLTTTAFEWNNYEPWNGPGWLPEVTFVASNESGDDNGETPIEPDPVVPNGFTATELFGNSIILVDGVKDSNWDASNPINIDQVRKQYLFNSAKSNANPATGNLKVMFTGNKLYIFVEVTDSTRDMNNISAWDAYGLNSYNSYKYHADHLDIYLDIKHDDPTNYGQAWGSAYNNGKDVAAHFELAAGAGNLTYAADGSTGWLYEPYADGQFSLAQYAVNHSTMYSVATETGYTFEMVIDLSEAGVTDFLVGKTIGLYVGYYDRYETSDAAANWGEQSVTTTSFAFDNYEPWNGPGWLPEVTFVANEAAEILEAAKSSAKEELAGYKSADLYREAEQAQLAAILAAANSAIDAVVVEDGITAIVTEAKAAIDALKTDAQYDEEEALGLENLKLSSKEELAGYKSADLYREAEQTQLATILATANTAIDEATSFDQVYGVITSSKAAIDALKTKAQYEAEELAAVKTSAKEELTGYKSADLYREAEQTQLATIIETANTAIDEATTADAVASALAAAKTAIDALKTKAQYETEELAAAKTSAKEELTGYKSADLYREAEQAQLASAVETGKTAIDVAVTTDEVASALAAAKTAIDALKTKAQYEAEELATAKNNAKAELDSYKSVDDYRTAEGVTYLTAVDNGKSAIDAATTVDAVNTALAAAKTAIDSIKTKAEYEAEEQAAAAAKALSDAKNAAKAELETYKSLEGLTEEQKAEVASKVAEGKIAIDDATTTEEVTSALAAAKTALDGITPVPAKKGCAGSIAVTLFGMLILAGLVFVLKKKKKLA